MKIEFTANEAKRLRSWGWRRKGIKQKQGVMRSLAIMGGASGRGRIQYKFDPDFHTGCWKFDGGRHHIIIGGEFVKNLAEASQENIAHVRGAYQSLLRHECWHGFATDRVADVVAELRREAIPFRLFNLFEDARIEHLARTCPDADKDAGGRFRWQNWEDGPATEINRAVQWFGLLIWREASAYKAMTAAETGYTWTGAAKVRVARSREICTRKAIREFYARAIAARDTFDLIPIIKEWCAIFGKDAPADGPRVHDDIGGVSDKAEAEGGPGDGEGEGNPGKTLESECLEDKKADGLTSEEQKELDYYQLPLEAHTKDRIAWDEKMVCRIVNRLTQIAASATMDRDELGATGSRLHLSGVLAQSNQFTRRTSETDGRRTLTVVVDCSGSMNQTWIKHGGKEFVIALARLHKRGTLDVRCWLSGTDGRDRCARVPMDRATSLDIARIYPHLGAECYAATLATPAVARDMAESSLTIAWTDGMITDGDVDARELRRKGVDIVGCAPRDPADSKIRRNILKHFGKGYLGHAEALARHIAHYVLNRA